MFIYNRYDEVERGHQQTIASTLPGSNAPDQINNVNALLPYREWMLALLVSLTLIVACSSKDPVDVLIKDLHEAAESRSMESFESRLATGFTGNDHVSRDEALAILRRYFLAYKRIRLDITNVNRTSQGNHLGFQVSFSGIVNDAFNLLHLLPSRAEYHFDLRLTEEDGTLKVRRAYWREISRFQ